MRISSVSWHSVSYEDEKEKKLVVEERLSSSVNLALFSLVYLR